MEIMPITEIAGFKIGHATDPIAKTGCTAILCLEGAVAGVDVRGGGPATRETDALRPQNIVDKIHCVMLSGGSAYGLDACSGAMAYLEELGAGFPTQGGVVPIVCGACLYDLTVGNGKVRPDKAMGYAACMASEKPMDKLEGAVGAGTGATVGKLLGSAFCMPSGIGTYAVRVGDLEVGAIVAVNALGDILDADSGQILAGLLTTDHKGFRDAYQTMCQMLEAPDNPFVSNTTIGCILTNAKIDKVQANKIAQVAHNGYARTIRPVHTAGDGDAIFVMAKGDVPINTDALATIAADVMARAVNRAVEAVRA